MNDTVTNIRNLSMGLGISIMLPVAVYLIGNIISKQLGYVSFSTDTKAIHFYVSAIIGITSIIIGSLMKVPFLGLGFILGGTASLVLGYSLYWSGLNDILKLISLLIAIGLLVFIGYRKTHKS